MRKLDVAIACGFTAWMLAEVWLEHLRPTPVVAPLMVVAGMSLAWRRSYPIPVVLVMLAAMIAQAAAGTTLHSADSPVFALLVASWSVGAYEDRRRAVLGLTLLVCGVWIAMGIDTAFGPDRYEGTDFPWIGGLAVAPGVLGIAFGARTRSLRSAQARAQELELERREAIATERARIARELHDVIAHSVSVMTVQAGAAEEMLKLDPSRAFAPINAVQETGRQALVEMKRLVGVLRDVGDGEVRTPQPRLADLARLVSRLRNAGLRVELRIEGEPREVPVGIELSAYRVVQEALTNTLKHGGGAPAVVVLRYGDRELAVEVRDEGRATRRSEGGHGLVGMRERVGIFGGTFEAGPLENGGFSVSAVLPLEGRA